MSTLALGAGKFGRLAISSPAAGEEARTIGCNSMKVVSGTRFGVPARQSYVFNDLYALAQEQAIEMQDSPALVLAQRFLFALPSNVPPPELAMDDDGDVSFDWRGPQGKMLTVALREDGRLAYAARISAFDKDHGIKRFDDAIPARVVELLYQVTAV
ncbi:hypothetical protein WK39_18185 [Burkholderia cepacia]|uniref:hypothetical protein n=1 Tax=Burkholderia cepacia TaxID=292 RepID=UPI00076C3EF0|nr:hypothetical protein [Burkholderia cepacia]KVS57674.1 hypothetical protein WK39_18185 [Burkholderia cepacia]KVS63532.1 hypothetical protein WK40_00205 [Burkholderia cepacia]